jgi:hypothetical protein
MIKEFLASRNISTKNFMKRFKITILILVVSSLGADIQEMSIRARAL